MRDPYIHASHGVYVKDLVIPDISNRIIYEGAFSLQKVMNYITT